MEDIAHMVSASLARHGFVPRVDPRLLQWSTWFHCESSLNVVAVPSKPGIFELANEQVSATGFMGGEKRKLTVFQVSEAEDVGMALGRLFLPETPAPCYVRYALIEDADQRHRALQEWMTASAHELADEVKIHSFTRENNDVVKDASPLAKTGS